MWEGLDDTRPVVNLQDVVKAQQRIGEQICPSPCVFSEGLSRVTGNRTFLKLENLQKTGSFKERGVLNRLLLLSRAERERGVIAGTAGNHGMAVAFHSQRLGISATVVIPVHAPVVKVNFVQRYAACTKLHGHDYDGAYEEARRISAEQGLTLIHNFDDPWIVAGQGTVGLELLRQNPDLDAVIVPVGGGGLIAGLAVALKTLKPHVRVIGVQTDRLPSMKEALAKGEVIRLPRAATIADGIAMREVGEIPFQLVQKYVDEIVTVTEDEIIKAILLLLEVGKTVAEGAAAAPLAALVERKIVLSGKKVAVVVSGGNIDVDLISRLTRRD